MPSLNRCLQDYDLGLLRIIAESADLDPPPGNRSEVARWLEGALLQQETLDDNLASLSRDAHAALKVLLARNGRSTMSDFAREYGKIRELGPARRDREQPWRSPISATEALWYHGLIGRAFLDTPNGPQEYVYVPDEILNQLGAPSVLSAEPLGAKAPTPQVVISASSAIVDDAATLLAYHRRLPVDPGRSGSKAWAFIPGHIQIPPAVPLVVNLLRDLGLLHSSPARVAPETTRRFLALDRAATLQTLIKAWRSSSSWNDLAALQHLRPSKDGWPNNPLQSRTAILDLMADVPVGEWWDMQVFLEDIRRSVPGFQRPAGSFESWYLRDDEGNMLNGLSAWDRVEGALLQFVILDVLHWLGISDLGLAQPGGPIQAFRLNPAAGMLFDRVDTVQIQETEGQIQVNTRGLLQFSRGASRTLRYQIARFTQWMESDKDLYRYALTPASLQLAREQGLQVRQLKQLLSECVPSVPPSLLTALDRWEVRGLEARVERLNVLRTETEELMQELHANRETKRYLKKLIGPRAAIVTEGDLPRLLTAATRAGIFIAGPDPESDEGNNIS